MHPNVSIAYHHSHSKRTFTNNSFKFKAPFYNKQTQIPSYDQSHFTFTPLILFWLFR